MNIHDQIRSNQRRSILLVIIFFCLIGVLSAFLGIFLGNIIFGLVIGMIFAVIYTIIVFNSGGNMILTMTGAKPVTKQEFPHLYHTVEGLTLAAGLKNIPKCYVIEDSALNTFATGKNSENSCIVVTTGLMKVLNRQELEGVIAHEMSHIKNQDIKVMMLAAVLVGITVLISDFLLRSLIFGKRDDEAGNANMATAHLFISTPFRNTKGWFTGLFSTHPDIKIRIQILEEM